MKLFNKFNAVGVQSIWIPVSVLGAFLLLSLIIQLTLSWISYQQIVPVNKHAANLEQIQTFLYDVEAILARQLPDDKTFNAADRRSLKNSLTNLLVQKYNLTDSTPAAIRLGQQLLDSNDITPQHILLNVLAIMRKAFQREAAEHARLTHALHESSVLEIKIGTIVLLVLPFSAVIILILLRFRIYKPLQQMALLMESLGDKQYKTISPEVIDPLFRKLFENYNVMVQRLSHLEDEHLKNEQELQQQIDKAARTLIEQQRNLADTERLAALGEVMAQMSHELRNPLAGVQMACSNLNADLAEKSDYQEYQQRLSLMCSEINRMIDLLNSFLSQSRHNPEPLTLVNVNNTIQDLLTLARYQMPAHIKLEYNPQQSVSCSLPDIQFRQVLLNLILNAQQAMADKPGKINIVVQCENNSLQLSVMDEGPGFPAAIIDHSIRAFATQRSGGTGLGLSMVKRFVNNHNGQLELKNLSPVGACVSLKLPCL